MEPHELELVTFVDGEELRPNERDGLSIWFMPWGCYHERSDPVIEARRACGNGYVVSSHFPWHRVDAVMYKMKGGGT